MDSTGCADRWTSSLLVNDILRYIASSSLLASDRLARSRSDAEFFNGLLMRELVVTNRAEADLREIWVYSFKNWGEGQADCYLDQLDDGLQKCRADPEDGKRRDEVRPGYWSMLVRKHVVFYTFTADEVLIHRVLHGSMEPGRYVEE